MTSDLDDRVDTTPPGPPERRRRGARRVGRALILLVTAAVLLAAGVAWWKVDQVNSSIAQRSVDALLPDDPSIRSDAATAADGTATAAENILVLGLDTRPADQVAPGAGTSQSDVMMIAHLSADRQRVDLVSIPRDLLIPAPTCKAWDYSTNTLSDRDFDNPYAQWKITNAYAVGGPQCTVKAVQALTGLRIDRLIVLQFGGFKDVVDAMGGLTMTFDGPVVDNGKTIIAQAGTQLIDGDQALALARARRVAGDPTGDLGRITPRGDIVVTGRVKEQINRCGEKIAAEEVENHLLAHPDVVDAAIVGVPDDFLGERTHAYVIPVPDRDPPRPNALRRFVRERGVAAYKVPDTVEVVDAFPVTGVGKTSRRALRTALAERATSSQAEQAEKESPS